MKNGDRVKFIGISIQVATPGELGVVMDLGGYNPDGTAKSGLPGMAWVGWDLGGGSWCWPAELEIVSEGPAVAAPPISSVPVPEDGWDRWTMVEAEDVYPDFDSYRRVAEDIAAMGGDE